MSSLVKMKSKSFDLGHVPIEKTNRTFDFVNLYRSSAEGSAANEKLKISENHDKEGHKFQLEPNKRERSPNKRKKKEKREPIDISCVTIDGPTLNISAGATTPFNESKVTSTPLGNRKNDARTNKVKSIMKNSSVVTDDAMNDTKIESYSNPKKRNKSVSFMLDDNEEVVVKKTKSDDASPGKNAITTPKPISKLKKNKKPKKDQQDEKENKVDDINQASNGDRTSKKQKIKKSKNKPKNTENNNIETAETQSETNNIETSKRQSENINIETTETQCESSKQKKKRRKRAKRVKKPEDTEQTDNTTSESTSQPEKVESKKMKHQVKPQTDVDNEEPASKTRKKDIKPEIIAEDLENLSIGDNAHTLSNLLDEMTVVDKEKRKKLKQKFNKNKKPKGPKKESEITENAQENTTNVQEKTTIGIDKTEDGQEKAKKWNRRKWNKDTKAEVNEESLDTTVLVENLPISILLSYKKLLAEHFAECGLIKNVGIAEVYPTEVSKPVFTTTINFYSDGAASKALEEDNAIVEGSRIRVKRPLPPTETTLVVRSYGALSAQAVGSAFAGAGRIRNIRHLVKGKHAMATAFIEFDGPESVERAMKMAINAKIGGKKIYLSKFEVRAKKSKDEKTNQHEAGDVDHSEGSQD